jgi:hypothetical protein
MYPSGGGNPNYQYANQPYGAPSKSPPPLQHPVPQHPIPDFGTAVHQSTPSPGLQHQQQQQQHYQYNQPMMQQQQQQQQQKMHQTYDPNAYTPQPQQTPQSNLYSQFGFNDPAAQMGMQFAGSAMAQGSAYVEKNVRNYNTLWCKCVVLMSRSLIDG